MSHSSSNPQPIGQRALHQMLGLNVPLPAVQSFVVQGARKTLIEAGFVRELYSPQWAPETSPIEHLRFALKHEAFDLRVLYAALKSLGPKALEAWVRLEPTGAYARRAWFLYEYFSGHRLDLDDIKTGNYVQLLDPERHYTAMGERSSRHRIINNLLGNAGFCPSVRRTAKLDRMYHLDLAQQAKGLTEQYATETLARAIGFLYTKETRSSFAIEGEIPSPNRTERFIQVLRKAADFDPTQKEALIQLQGRIVDPRYAASDWRDFQNFVGETTRRYGQNVHFICPRPEDVSSLMAGWMAMNPKLYGLSDAVVASAVSAFAFVFIHPFEDGNGRIHRFMIHQILAKTGFSPSNLIFPVSAAILRDKHLYDEALENFSKPLFDHIDWSFGEGDSLVVHKPTLDLYRFLDATVQAEYLYDRVKETIEVDLKEELNFLAVFDRAMEGVREVVDMPDRKASLFVRLCVQNGGRLSKAKREQFSELTDEEIEALERTVTGAMQMGDWIK